MLFVLLIAVCAVTAMGACSKAPETGEYTGTLTEALDNSIIVSDDNDMQEFQTGGDTTYDLGDEDRLCVDDVLDISYHEESGKKYADRVILREHIEKEETFAGTVTEVSDKAVTVTGKSMTVEFARNGNSQTDGDLSIGDEVEVVYTGDLSEYPYAAKIRMVTENQKPENGKISGVVSEFTKDSILIAIDSANSYRFSIRNGVGISGADKYVRIGDNVVIGAGSVVTRDLPPNGVYAGSPARFVCSIGEFDERHRSNLIDHPQFIQPWRYWRDSATAEERQDMKERLKNGFGYIR